MFNLDTKYKMLIESIANRKGIGTLKVLYQHFQLKNVNLFYVI